MERAYNVESNHPNVQFNYARLLHKVGRIKKALPILEKFLEHRPHFSPALNLMEDLRKS